MPSVRILLLSTYELGHQPLGLASPAAALRAAGHEVRCIDLAVENLNERAVREASLIGISVPMHTAARLALALVPRLRALQPSAPVALYGLYAPAMASAAEAAGASAALGGEYEPALIDLANATAIDGYVADSAFMTREAYGRTHNELPERAALPPVERYAHLEDCGRLVPAGYVEATRGCAHRCLHCPLTATYGGRLRLVAPEVVLADIAQQVEAGAGHITFGDPDFLNAVPHSLAIVEALHARHPAVTFDATIKVEHLIEHAEVLPRLRELGCAFVTSAFESTSDRVLRELDKGHTRADLDRALELGAASGLALRPTWVAFTPWTTLEDYIAQLEFTAEHGLANATPAVQHALALLVPPGSALIEPMQAQGLLGAYDESRLTYEWRALDERTVALQPSVARIAEEAHARGEPGSTTLGRMIEAAREARDGTPPREPLLVAVPEGPPTPGLTEHWFC